MTDPDKVYEASPRTPRDQVPFLDAIDEFHSLGVGQIVCLPQLVVCGSRCNATHSILEGLARVRLPVRNEPGVLIVTMIILRYHEVPRFRVTIEPGPWKENKDDFQRLETFEPIVSDIAEQLPLCVEQATKFIESITEFGFSDNIIRVEIFGPDKPDLTLINLPRLVFPERSASGERGKEFVQRIKATYMKNPRSILVTVISAEADTGIEKACSLGGKYAQGQKRVFGIVTQLDNLEANSKTATSWTKIMKQPIPASLLGLHFLCGQSFGSRYVSDTEKDKQENAFFNREEWDVVTKLLTGMERLRPRLDGLLATHVRNSFPGLVSDIEDKLKAHQSRLAKLNIPRETIQQQKALLFHLSSAFERITEQALSGMYTSDFFTTSVDSENRTVRDPRRLRARIRGLNEDFADIMVTAGCRRFIYDVNHQIISSPNPANAYANIRIPEHTYRVAFECEINEQIQQHRGIEFPGNFNQTLIGSLFRDQSKPWEEIARVHLLNSWEGTREFTKLLLDHLVDQDTSAVIMHDIIDPQLDSMKDTLLAKLEELTAHNKRGYPLPLHRTYLRGQSLSLDQSCLVKMPMCKSDRLLTKLEQTLRSNPQYAFTKSFSIEELKMAALSLEFSDNQFAVSEIVDQMQSYYNHALAVFIDNVSTLGIENCLLAPLGSILTTQKISNMDDSEIAKLFIGTQGLQGRLTSRSEKLQTASQKLQRFRPLNWPAARPAQPAPNSQPVPQPSTLTNVAPRGMLFTGKPPNPFAISNGESPFAGMNTRPSFHPPLSTNPGLFMNGRSPYHSNMFNYKRDLKNAIFSASHCADLFTAKPSSIPTGFGPSQFASTGPWATATSAANTIWPPYAAFSPAKRSLDLDRNVFYLSEMDASNKVTNRYQSISLAESCKRFSFEELRWAYYELGQDKGKGAAQKTT
ncbi:hypothetical protein N7457_005690 [Penicillium paradoxum]|uniref:uncharacterized protein n=1 Tax=Penicillium paradoxum TaxID=176176 RepID=UPI002547632A|nr:uncharacterized protein N7457_005690 [Penicillium paradoxum]KAJ5780530.1 hypothetical protein N7457_005690 [Penicillium paradoxum]